MVPFTYKKIRKQGIYIADLSIFSLNEGGLGVLSSPYTCIIDFLKRFLILYKKSSRPTGSREGVTLIGHHSKPYGYVLFGRSC